MSRFFLLRILVVLTLGTALSANEECCFTFLPPFKGSIGPEICHVKRTREGGTSQSGPMVGVRASFERICRYKWYIGIEGLYSKGTIKGHSGGGSDLKSSLVDRFIEGRLGYTFQSKCGFLPSITPFLGYGYADETNHYKSPSPLLLRFINASSYFSFGFLSQVNITDAWVVGLNLKARSQLNPKCKVKHDPVFDNLTMHINGKVQYRLEIPIYYDFTKDCTAIELGLVPFYEWRHYGGRENYPFDFLDTKLRLYGANIQFTYRF